MCIKIKASIKQLKLIRLQEKNTNAVKVENAIMLEYSAINNRANKPPAYSILNPDTNSDSPSGKSKGARPHSEVMHKIQHPKTIGDSKLRLMGIESRLRLEALNSELKIRKLVNKNAKPISYDTLCATLRNLPIIEYTEFEDHPPTKWQ